MDHLRPLLLWTSATLTGALLAPGERLRSLLPDTALGDNGRPPADLFDNVEREFIHRLAVTQRYDVDLSRSDPDAVDPLADGCVTLTCLDQAFEDPARLHALLQRVRSRLRYGGYFYGVCAESSALWSSAQKEYEARQLQRAPSGPPIPPARPTVLHPVTADMRFTLRAAEYWRGSANAAYGQLYTLSLAAPESDSRRDAYLVNFAELCQVATSCGFRFVDAINLRDFCEEFHKPLQHCDWMAAVSGVEVAVGPHAVFRPSPRALEMAAYFSTFVLVAADADDFE